MKGVALLLCQAKGGPQQVNAFKTVPPFLGSWKRSYSFRMENGAEVRIRVDAVLHFLLLGALRSLGLTSGDSRTGSSRSLSITFFLEQRMFPEERSVRECCCLERVSGVARAIIFRVQLSQKEENRHL